MSSKQSTSKKESRIAKKEAMVTRHKSAQMKRQLRTKDRSMKHVTDLLKSPTKESPTNQQITVPKNVQKPKTPPKPAQSLLKTVEKVQKLPEKVFRLSKVLRKKVAVVEDVEFYPNKRKRTLDVKKVVLKPINEMQMVGGIVGSVKRKCRVPHKAPSKPKPASPESTPMYSKLSIAEVISIMEEDLTDEDLMEILTCPSPVWWEDGPGEEYIEEAVFSRTPEPPPETKTQEVINIDDNAPDEEKKPEDIEIPNLNKKSEKFLKKRSKLEGLLGNIKNKNNAEINKSIKTNLNENRVVSSPNNVFNEDLVVVCSNYRKRNATSCSDNENSKNKTRKHLKSDSDSDDDIFHDSSMNEDELLRSLENMDIPIDTTKADVIVIDDDDDEVLEIIPDEIKRENPKELDEKTISETVEVKTNPNDKLVSPKTMPSLLKFEVVSPKSSESCSSKNSTASQDLDTISDTNIKFIIDDETDDGNMIIDEKPVVIKVENDLHDIKQESSTETNSETDTLTTHANNVSDTKIFNAKNVDTNETSQEDRDKSAKINDYYKKCKKVYQKKEKTDINKNDLNPKSKEENGSIKFIFCESCLPKTKKVSDDKNVKYCLKCSSIFDSDDCIYCLEKSQSNVFTCVPCKTKFCCQVLYKKHNKNAHMVETSS